MQRDDHIRIQGEDSHLQARERGLQNKAKLDFDLGHLAPKTVRK